MNSIFIHGVGAVSPAGWGMDFLRRALDEQQPLAVAPLARPGWERPLPVRRVPEQKSPSLNHARLRRSSPMSLYAAAAAMEALRQAGFAGGSGHRLGIIFCVTGGCVQFSRRFYDETWRNPATASPLVFAETVFNAPSSHLGAILASDSVNYTLIGDPGAFLHGVALAAQWLLEGKVDSCLVIGAEELDWLTADACRHFARQTVCSEGAGALYLSCAAPTRRPGAELIAISDSHLYLKGVSRMRAIQEMRAELPRPATGALLCDSRQGTFRDAPETEAWKDWSGPRLSPRSLLGEGLMAAAAWQCAAAVDALRQKRSTVALVSSAGSHQQAIGACFSSYE
jgi:3-oxoacyl-(acyl-carrier-protein) synthase